MKNQLDLLAQAPLTASALPISLTEEVELQVAEVVFPVDVVLVLMQAVSSLFSKSNFIFNFDSSGDRGQSQPGNRQFNNYQRGAYNGQQNPRGRGTPGNFGMPRPNQREKLKFDGDYDFEKANEQLSDLFKNLKV